MTEHDRRESERFATHLKGEIVDRWGIAFAECSLSDISASGARLGFTQPVEIPLEFELQIPEEGVRASARLIWANGREYGVMFTD